MTQDEEKAMEWAKTAVQFHEKAESRGLKTPFPELCACRGNFHKHDAAQGCPVISTKTQEARMKALGEVLNHG